LKNGHNRDLVKAASSPFPSSASSFGFIASRKRTQAAILLEEELNPVQLQAIAFEMVSAARSMSLQPSSPSSSSSSSSSSTHTETHAPHLGPNSTSGTFFSTKSPNPTETQQQKIEHDQEIAILKILDLRLRALNQQLSQLQAAKGQLSQTADTSTTPSPDSDTPPLETSDTMESTIPLPSTPTHVEES
jgi:hypothetical protein